MRHQKPRGKHRSTRGRAIMCIAHDLFPTQPALQVCMQNRGPADECPWPCVSSSALCNSPRHCLATSPGLPSRPAELVLPASLHKVMQELVFEYVSNAFRRCQSWHSASRQSIKPPPPFWVQVPQAQNPIIASPRQTAPLLSSGHSASACVTKA